MVRRSNALIDERRRDAARRSAGWAGGTLTGTPIRSSPTGEMFTPSVTFDPTFTIIKNLLYGNLSEVSLLDRNRELPLVGYCNVDYEINRNQF